MLHAVQLPLGLVLQGSSSSSSSNSTRGLQAAPQQQQQQQQQQLSVGSRVLALAPGHQLWQQAEITAISETAAAAAAALAVDHSAEAQQQQQQQPQQQQLQGSHACTVLLVDSGQSLILPVSAIAPSSTAAVTAAELDAATAAGGQSTAADSIENIKDNDDMSISSKDEDDGLSEGGSSSSGFVSGSEQGDGSESEGAEEDDDDEAGMQGYARVGLGGGVLEHAR
jgi:hypothetical protein